MKEFKGTPCPWRVSEKRGDLIDIRHNNNGIGAISINLAHVVARQSWLKEAEANANLIAAAPELLEALQETIDEIGFWMSQQNPELKKKIEAAIKKALGE